MPLVFDGSGPITGITSLNTAVSSTELGYLDGVTSALQTQINTKQNSGVVYATSIAWVDLALVTSTTNTTFRNMKTWTYYGNTFKVISVGSTMWINSGSNYWTWRMFNVTKGIVVPLLNTGDVPTNNLSSGGGISYSVPGVSSHPHTATSQPYMAFDMSTSSSGDTVALQMSPSDANGVTLVTSTQQLNLKNLKVFNGMVTGLSGLDNLAV